MKCFYILSYCLEQGIDVDEELGKLQPSQRLLDFYREKVTKIEAQHQDMLELFEKLVNILFLSIYLSIHQLLFPCSG